MNIHDHEKDFVTFEDLNRMYDRLYHLIDDRLGRIEDKLDQLLHKPAKYNGRAL